MEGSSTQWVCTNFGWRRRVYACRPEALAKRVFWDTVDHGSIMGVQVLPVSSSKLMIKKEICFSCAFLDRIGALGRPDSVPVT